MNVHRQAANDEVLHPRIVQRPDNGFNAVDFHDPRVMLAEFCRLSSLLQTRLRQAAGVLLAASLHAPARGQV